jgi:Bacterial Ig-like domain
MVDVLSTSGDLLRHVDDEWEAGVELATWTVSAPTTLLVRVSNWYANGNQASYELTSAFVDEVPPRVVGLSPGPNAEMVPTRTPIIFTFSEPVTGVDAGSVTLSTMGGRALAAGVTYVPATRRVTVVPHDPLPSGTRIILHLGDGIRDSANLPLLYRSYRFTTMPGVTLEPSRRITFAAGTHVGHRLNQAGTILGLRTARLGAVSGANVAQRSALPNLPGAWLYVETGIWAGTWVQEGAGARISGIFDQRSLPATTRVVVAAGRHTGREYSSSGTIQSSRSVMVSRTSGANVDAVAVINGSRHYRVTAGLLAGTWVRESPMVYRAGIVDRMSLSPERRILIGAGTHVGFRLDADGDAIASVRERLAWTSGASASAWAVVNGRARVLVSSGIWAGTWLPAEDVLAFER